MSSETPQGPSGMDESKSAPKPRIGDLVRRMRSMLRRGSSSKEMASPSAPTQGEELKPEEQTPAIKEAAASPSAPPAVPTETPAEKDTSNTQFQTSRQAVFEERARTIFAKYDLVLEPEWMPPLATTNTTTAPAATVERVHKPIRIRVHRYCHRCETVFGPDRICAKCDHKRCKKCPRYPTEKKGTDGAGGRRDRSTQGKGKDRARSETREPLLVIQSRGAGQILVHQPIMQRIRRTCHKCDMQFLPSSAQVCSNCGHVRCTKCPRSPAKLNKWESGYPGDEKPTSEEEETDLPKRQERVFRKPRQRVRWHCEQCSTLFLEGSKTCRSCGHQKCENCKRAPPKKTRDSFDPEVVNALHEKLAALVVTTSAG